MFQLRDTIFETYTGACGVELPVNARLVSSGDLRGTRA